MPSFGSLHTQHRSDGPVPCSDCLQTIMKGPQLLLRVLALTIAMAICSNLFLAFYNSISNTSDDDLFDFLTTFVKYTSLNGDDRKMRRPRRIVISGVMRNVGGDHLRAHIPKLVALGDALGRKTQYVFYENDSKDDTRKVLKELLGNHSRATLLLETGQAQGDRTKRIAKARNKILDFIEEELAAYDFMIMTDMDGVCGGRDMSLGYDVNAFETAFRSDNNWDAVFFLFEPYWDLWAFRHPHWMPYNMFGPKRGQNIVKNSNDMDKALRPGQWLDVDSAFMMLGVYRMNAIRGARYSGIGLDGKPDCEHVAFHRDMKRLHNATLLVAPWIYCQGDPGPAVSDYINETIVRKESAASVPQSVPLEMNWAAGNSRMRSHNAEHLPRHLLDSVMAAVQEPKLSFPVPSDAQFVPSSTAFPNISIFPIRQFYKTHGGATPKFGNVNFEGISAHWDPVQVTSWDKQRSRPTGKGPAFAKPEDGGKAVLGTWPTKLNRLTMLHVLKCGGSTMMDTVGDLRQRLQATGDVWTWGERSRTDDPSIKTWDDATVAGTNDRRHAIIAIVRDPVARFVSVVKEVAREEKGLIDQCFKGGDNNAGILCCAAKSLSELSGQKKFLQNKHWATQAHTIFANVLRRPDSEVAIPLVLLPFELIKRLIHELGGDPLFNYRNGTDRSYFDWSINSKALSTQTKRQLTTLKVNDLDAESIKLICNLYNVDVQLLKWAGVDVPLCQRVS